MNFDQDWWGALGAGLAGAGWALKRAIRRIQEPALKPATGLRHRPQILTPNGASVGMDTAPAERTNKGQSSPRIGSDEQCRIPQVNWATAIGPNGAVRVVEGKPRYGWFEYSEQPRTISNYLTQQSLVVVSSRFFDTTSLHRCEYRDPDLPEPPTIPLQLGWTEGSFQLFIDYNRIFPVQPAYGLWRRVDDFITDALACWPDHIFCESRLSLGTLGGWRSGVWQPELKRKFSSGKVASLSRPEQHPGMKLTQAYAISKPFLIPLDSPSPPPWRYVDHPTPEPEVELPFQRLPGLDIPYISAEDSPLVFKGRVPYLERQDGAAWIFPAKLEPLSHRGEDPMTNLWYTYLDHQVFFTFRSHQMCRALELNYCQNYGFRHFPPAEDLWTADIWGTPIPGTTPRTPTISGGSYLSYQGWKHLAVTVGDAWPAWTSPPRTIQIDVAKQLPDNYGRSARIGDHGDGIVYGFNAGMSNSHYRLSFS